MRVQLTQSMEEQLVGLFLNRSHIDDELVDLLRVFELVKIFQRLAELFAALQQQFRELTRLGMHFLHIEHIETLYRALHVIEHVVKLLRERNDVFAIDGRHEVDRNRVEYRMHELIARVLDFMRALDVIVEAVGALVVFDDLYEQLCLGNRKLCLLFECLEIIELLTILVLCHVRPLTRKKSML